MNAHNTLRYSVNRQPNTAARKTLLFSSLGASLCFATVATYRSLTEPVDASGPTIIAILSGVLSCTLVASRFMLRASTVIARQIPLIALLVVASQSTVVGTIVILFLVQCVAACTSITRAIGSARTTTQRRTGRPSLSNHLDIISKDVMLTSILATAYDYDGRPVIGWRLTDIGVSALGAHLSFSAGVLFAAITHGVLEHSWLTASGVCSRIKRAALTIALGWFPRNPLHKRLAVVHLVLVRPFYEEVICRGFLVYALADTIGVPLAILSGLATHLGLHAYQGLQCLPRHVLFFLTVTALVFSPVGLPGAIGFHAASNAWYVTALATSLRRRKHT